MQTPKYIAIEGVIGVGKTTLALKLAERLSARPVLEEFEDNPFLERFYEHPERYAFQTQLSFLASRYKQQQHLRNFDLFHEYLITDYIFDKDKIFAYLNLQDDELRLYETIVNLMDKSITLPDLVVYLQSTPERLLQNIKNAIVRMSNTLRRTTFAIYMTLTTTFFRYRKTPLLIVNTTELDFVANPADFEVLYNLICNHTHSGTEYFNPEKRLY